MFVVAIAELRGASPDLGALAAALGTTLYELKLTLGAGFPAVVRATTDDAQRASALLAIERFGHAAVSCDTSAMAASRAMTALQDFRLEQGGIAAGSNTAEQLPYDDVHALIRATHRTTTTSTRDEKERKLRPGMALLTGGLIMSKTTTREVKTVTENREQVLYLFRESGAVPWILRERAARYTGLGAELRPTSLENFATTVRSLRARAASAFYDERLLNSRPIRGVAEGVAATDILATLLAEHARASRR